MIFEIIGIVLTIVIEFIVYLISIRQKIGKLLLYALLINAFTWPLVNLFDIISLSVFLLIEFLVFVVEFVLIMLLFRIKWWKALIISFIANLITMVIAGFLINVPVWA